MNPYREIDARLKLALDNLLAAHKGAAELDNESGHRMGQIVCLVNTERAIWQRSHKKQLPKRDKYS